MSVCQSSSVLLDDNHQQSSYADNRRQPLMPTTLKGKNFKRLKTALINFFVGADIDQDDLLFSDDQFQGDAKADIDGRTMQAGKSALERMQPQ